MSYSIRSNDSTLLTETDDTFTPSLLEKESAYVKWWYAARWSASIFCDSVEERLGCGETPWENEFEEETITIIEEAPHDELASRKQQQMRVGEYHRSMTSQKKGKTTKKKEKEILDQLIQGNHRGWSSVRPSSQKKKTYYTYDKDSYRAVDYSGTYDSGSSDDDSYQKQGHGKYSIGRSSAREASISNLERESPSFGSNGSGLRAHSRSFGSYSASSGERSRSSTVAKSSFVTPQKMLSTYQSPTKTEPTKSIPSRGARIKAIQNSSSKKIALGKQRAMNRSRGDAVGPKPKNVPGLGLVNHSVFHQTLDNKKKRAMGNTAIEE